MICGRLRLSGHPVSERRVSFRRLPVWIAKPQAPNPWPSDCSDDKILASHERNAAPSVIEGRTAVEVGACSPDTPPTPIGAEDVDGIAPVPNYRHAERRSLVGVVVPSHGAEMAITHRYGIDVRVPVSVASDEQSTAVSRRGRCLRGRRRRFGAQRQSEDAEQDGCKPHAPELHRDLIDGHAWFSAPWATAQAP